MRKHLFSFDDHTTTSRLSTRRT